MRHITFAQSDSYPVALLIKSSAFNKHEIETAYVQPLESKGVPQEALVAMTAEYNEAGKAPVKFIKEYLETLLPALDSIGCQYIYCADAAYFKVLTKAQKAEPNLGYVLPCKIKDYEHFQVILGINHKSLIYDPANEGKLNMSIECLANNVQGKHQELGEGIIHAAHYPKSLTEIQGWLQKLHSYPHLAADIEAFSLDFDKAGVGTITFCWNQHEGVAFPVDYSPMPNPDDHGFHGVRVDNPQVKALLKEFFETYEGNLRWHGSTYDLEVLIYELWMDDLLDTPGLLKGLEIMTADFDDTKTIAYLATNTTAGNKLGLKELAHPFAGNWAQDEIKDIRKIPLPDLLQYNLIDGLCTNWVFDTYYPVMVADQQEELYRTLMKPSLKTIMQKEMTGMPLDPDQVLNAERELQDIVAQHEQTLRKPIGALKQIEHRIQHDMMVAANAKLKTKQHPIEKFQDEKFNPNSGPQKQILLYEIMDLPVIDLTETKQPATGRETLEKLINHTQNQEYKEILTALIEHARASKILSTFIKAFKRAIDKGDGVVWLHGNFNLGGTVSGRLSSSDPNLQNIPSGSTYGKLIKKCFRAPDGFLFCGADFNSLEDYISALTTKDPNKLKVYEGHKVFEIKIGEKVQIIRDDAILRYQGKEYTGEEFYETFGAL